MNDLGPSRPAAKEFLRLLNWCTGFGRRCSSLFLCFLKNNIRHSVMISATDFFDIPIMLVDDEEMLELDQILGCNDQEHHGRLRRHSQKSLKQSDDDHLCVED